MLHSSLSGLGPVKDGAQTVVDAFLEVVGSEGTVIFPAFTADLWHGRLGKKDCKNCGKGAVLCHSNEPGAEGIIPESAPR
ncbi:MAG: AAC(3) family N-acetyltransferase [Sedimentisphaerales bacterium]|nr:AAC(3) family N-acetyltransferase [Sedimentisphaerales bacterium]